MRGLLLSRRCAAVLLLFTAVIVRPVAAQKYAPIVGGWHIDLDLGGVRHSFDFETNGQGVHGRGTGRFRIGLEGTGSSLYPAAWCNTDPQRISIAGDVALLLKDRAVPGTLVLRLTLVAGQEKTGDALFVDAALATQHGTFTMSRTLAPESLVSSNRN